MKIIIPTKGRVNDQLSLSNIPLSFKDKTYLVVCKDEYEEYNKKYNDKANILIRSEEANESISKTREWIINHFNEDKILVLDDDLLIKKRDVIDNKIKNLKLEENDFEELYNSINTFLDTYICGSIVASSTTPSIKLFPNNENNRIVNNVFYNVKKLPKDINWIRCKHTEDFDVALQLLSKGFKNIQITNFCVFPKSVNSKGGCYNERSLESHNESQLLFHSYWKDFVKIKRKICKEKEWKDKEKISLTIYWKKVYKSSFN